MILSLIRHLGNNFGFHVGKNLPEMWFNMRQSYYSNTNCGGVAFRMQFGSPKSHTLKFHPMKYFRAIYVFHITRDTQDYFNIDAILPV